MFKQNSRLELIREQRQEDCHKFWASLGYVARFFLRTEGKEGGGQKKGTKRKITG